MPRVPRRKRLTRRAGWWRAPSKKSTQNSVENATPVLVNPPVNEYLVNDPAMNPYPIVHQQVDHETENPANHEYLQNADELIQHLKRHFRKPSEDHMQCHMEQL